MLPRQAGKVLLSNKPQAMAGITAAGLHQFTARVYFRWFGRLAWRPGCLGLIEGGDILHVGIAQTAAKRRHLRVDTLAVAEHNELVVSIERWLAGQGGNGRNYRIPVCTVTFG